MKRPLGGCGLSACFASEIRGENSERRGRHPVEPTGLPDGPRPRRPKLAAHLVREASHETVVNITKHEAFVAAEGVDVGSLALQIDIVFCIDLEMAGDR